MGENSILEKPVWLVCRKTEWLERTEWSRSLVGKTRTLVSHVKEFKPNAKSSKMPLEGIKEGLGK